jgi:hypothetical protein
MGMSEIKNSLKKLSFLGDYSSLVVPVVLAVVAGLLFIPTILMQRNLKAEIRSESIRDNGRRVESYLEQKELSACQWEQEKDFQDAFAEDAQRISLLAESSSQRQLLRNNLFPAPPNEVSQYIYRDFGNNFRKGVEGMITRLGGRDCPTQIELDKHLKKPAVYNPLGHVVRRGEGNLGESDKIVIDYLCTDIARENSVYVNPSDIAGYDFWQGYEYPGKETAVEDCWYWQIGYWIIEDVFATVEKVNHFSESIFSSPVKRIVSVSFTTADKKSGTRITGFGGAAGAPGYVVSLKDGLVVPFTARMCDDGIDVVHFRVVVVIDTAALPGFFRELCSAKEHKFSGFSGDEEERVLRHNQITILKSSYEAIDPADEEHRLYRYGEDAVVKLELVCEYIFNRKGYEEVMPLSVKEMLREAIQSRTPAASRPAPVRKEPVKSTEEEDDEFYKIR